MAGEARLQRHVMVTKPGGPPVPEQVRGEAVAVFGLLEIAVMHEHVERVGNPFGGVRRQFRVSRREAPVGAPGEGARDRVLFLCLC